MKGQSANTKLVKYIIATNFAPGANRLLASAVSRILMVYIGAWALGSALAKAISRADLPPGIPMTLGLVLVTSLGFIFASLLLLVVHASKQGSKTSEVWSRVVRLLPARPGVRWMADNAPTAVIVGCIAIFGTHLVASASAVMELQEVIVCLALIVSLLSAQGLMAVTAFGLPTKAVMFACLSAGSMWLIDLSLKVESAWQAERLNQITLGLLFLPVFGLLQNYFYGYRLKPDVSKRQLRQLLPNLVPAGWWLLVKLLRNKRTRNSFLLALGLSSLLAASIVLRHQKFAEPISLLLVAGVLAATFACELRGIIRRFNPPEIIQLSGLSSLVWLELKLSISASLVIGLPLATSLIGRTDSLLWFGISFVVLQVFCSTAGLFASTLLVPGNGEVGAQFFSAAIASGILVVFLKYAKLDDLSQIAQVARWLSASAGLVTLIFMVERIRRFRYGRT